MYPEGSKSQKFTVFGTCFIFCNFGDWRAAVGFLIKSPKNILYVFTLSFLLVPLWEACPGNGFSGLRK
jgi:hypothetical protein